MTKHFKWHLFIYLLWVFETGCTYAAQAGLELTTLLPPPFQCWHTGKYHRIQLKQHIFLITYAYSSVHDLGSQAAQKGPEAPSPLRLPVELVATQATSPILQACPELRKEGSPKLPIPIRFLRARAPP
jgi:hypothetical protein